MENQTFNMTAVSPCKDLPSEIKEFFEGVRNDFDMTGLFPCEDLKSEMKVFFEGVRNDFEAPNCMYLCDTSDIFRLMWHDWGFKAYLKCIAHVFVSNVKNRLDRDRGVGIMTYLFHSKYPRETRFAFLDFVLKHFDQLFTFNGNTVTVNTNL